MGLEWEPGVMQVDFGRVLAVIGGRADGRALPGRHVPPFEHAVRVYFVKSVFRV